MYIVVTGRFLLHLAVACSLSVPAPAGDPPALLPSIDERPVRHRLTLLPTGDVWGGDLESRPAEGWLGLHEKDGGSYLGKTAVEFHSDNSDPERVTIVSRPPGPAFLFRDLPELQPGPVTEAIIEGGPLHHTRTLRLSLEGKEYLLRLKGSDEFFADAVITLSSGVREQVLFRANGWADEAHFNLLWAGDLDRDGELDLLVTFSPKYSMFPLDLLLSSGAERGDLVRHAATYLHYSC